VAEAAAVVAEVAAVVEGVEVRQLRVKMADRSRMTTLMAASGLKSSLRQMARCHQKTVAGLLAAAPR
jgi:hypothetical protein